MKGAAFEFAPAIAREQDGDILVRRCSKLSLVFCTFTIAVSAFGCADQVYSYFAAELAWLVLCLGLLMGLIGLVGLCVSRTAASTAFRLQFAVLLLAVAVGQGTAGLYATMASGVTGEWILDGCDGFQTLGSWTDAGNIEAKMRDAYNEHELLRACWQRCRALNPLVYDLAECGKRARCSAAACGGVTLASELPLYGWFQHLQVSSTCGGFCEAEVPVFGLKSMGDTLITRGACASDASRWIARLGFVVGVVAVGVGACVFIVACTLFCSATRMENEDFEAIALSDAQHDDTFSEVDYQAS